MANEQTGAENKSGRWLLRDVEDKYIRRYLMILVPSFVQTYHLTLMTIIWSAGVVISSWMARTDIRYLWVVSLMLVLQYVTDLLDGAIGRERNTGLIKWGYYMDHFLDYIFFTSLIIGYAFIFPVSSLYWLVAIGLIQIGFMVNMFLSFAMTNAFGISFAGIGPTEVRALYILFNIYIIFFGLYLPVILMPYFAIVMVIALATFVFRTSKTLWRLDMEAKQKSNGGS